MLFDEIKFPVQKRSKERLEHVIQTTVQILEKDGLHKCTIPEIAMAAKLPKINIYQYFPTVNHLFSIMVKRYLEALQAYVLFKNEDYKTWTTKQITIDLITRVSEFYNLNKATSILILGGSVHVDGFNLQEMVIEQISEDLHYIFENKSQPLIFQNKIEITYLIEIVFALLKHSFYKFGKVTPEILQESIQLSHLYIQSKGHSID